MATFEDDWIAFPHAVGIVDELKAVFAERLLDIPCFAGVLPGDLVSWDFVGDDCGAMSWCRVASVFPSAIGFAPDATPQAMLTFAATLELGTLRTIAVPDNGEPATVEQQYDATRLQLADMNAMVEAICRYCSRNEVPLLMGTYSPAGPAGAAVGGAWQFTVKGV